jgi:diguanylate cyclase (GGDEF)-like protein
MRVFRQWPRRFAYPAAGILLSVALVAGLLTLQGALARRVPTASWILEELRQQPFVYAYLMLATLAMMTILGWIVGRKEDLLEELSVTDPLTGLANRRRMRAAATDELNRSARYGTPLALLLVDLDRLKEINDRHGHGNGDRALELVADALRRSCRATDVAARFGGDEFVVLAVNTTAIEALALAHRIRAAVKRSSALAAARVKQDAQIHHTVSIGVADLDGAALPTFDGLHAAADGALYAAKLAGRDRATAAPTKPEATPGGATPEPSLRDAGDEPEAEAATGPTD